MVINILTVGKLKNKNIQELVKKYSKRISGNFQLNWIEIEAEKIRKNSKEAKKIISQIPKNTWITALSEDGNVMNSLEFSRWINRLNDSAKDICFIIGGAEGLHESVIKSADEIISLSRMTFPHELVRAILAEQIYRAVSIIKGFPYHRD